LSENIAFICTKCEHLASLSVLFHRRWKGIIYFPTMDVHCVHPVVSTNSKQLPYYLKRAETNVVLIVFDVVFCYVRAYIFTIS